MSTAAVGASRLTFTQRLVRVPPTRADLVDAAFLLALTAVALLGFETTFSSHRYLLVGMLGAALGVAVSHLSQRLRWPWLVTVVLAALAFWLFGGSIVLAGGLVPTPTTVLRLSELAVGSWKDLLVSLPPLSGASEYLVVPYLIGLIGGASGYEVARRTGRAAPALLAPLLMFGGVVLMGTVETSWAPERGLALTVLALGWLLVRWRRRNAATARISAVPAALAAMILLASLAGGAMVATSLGPPDATRVVARTYIEPPFATDQYPSPLVGFRKYGEGMKLLYDQDLVTVSGAPAGSLLRIAVLDDYDGVVWTGSSGGSGSYQRVGTHIPEAGVAGTATTVTIQPAYAASSDLNPWLPSLGSSATVEFGGPQAAAHAQALRYNVSAGQGLVTDRLKSGDTVTAHSTPVVSAEAFPDASGAVDLDTEAYDFLTASTDKWYDSQSPAADQLAAAAKTMSAGAWSDGTRSGEGQYLPGHSRGRLLSFAGGRQLVGSDEQYAATFALLANQLGIPARVIFGAVLPASGVVKGQDITAWVELRDRTGTWTAVPPGRFIPPRDRHPEKIPPDPSVQTNAQVVPPPTVTRPPGAVDELLDTDPAANKVKKNVVRRLADLLPAWLSTGLKIASFPVGAVLLAAGVLIGSKLARAAARRRRGSPKQQVAAGWREIADLLRDLGRPVPAGGTRRDQVADLSGEGSTAVRQLAARADELVFGPAGPDPVTAAAYWTGVVAARHAVLNDLDTRRRWLTRLNPRSLVLDLRERLATGGAR